MYQPKTISSSELIENGEYDVFGANGIIGKYSSYNHEFPEILLTCRGATCGTINVSNPKSWINGNAMVIHRKSESLTFSFLRLAMMSLDYSTIITGAAQPQITRQSLAPVKIPVPPMAVQKQIVAELDKINEVIADCRNLLQTLDSLAQSLFYDFFGDPVTNPKTFPIVPLSDVFALITDGTHQTPTYTTDIENGVKFLSAKDVVNGFIDWTKIKYIPFDLHLELHKRLAPRRGDILLCKNGTTGICALVETDDIFDIYVSLALLRPKANSCSKYLVYAINNPFTREQFNHSLKGIGVPNLHLNKIRSTKIILPPLELQEKFAKRIEQIEAQKKAVEETIENLQTLLDSRMDYWFN